MTRYLDPPLRQRVGSPAISPLPTGGEIVPYSPGPLQSGPIQGELLDPPAGYNPPRGGASPPPVLDAEIIQPKANSIPRPSSVPGSPVPRPSPGGIPGRFAGPAAGAIGVGLGLAFGGDPGQIAAGTLGGVGGAALGGAIAGPFGAAVGGVLGQALGEAAWNMWYPPQHLGGGYEEPPTQFTVSGLGRAGGIYEVYVTYQVQGINSDTLQPYTVDIGTGYRNGVVGPYSVVVNPSSVQIVDANGTVHGFGGTTFFPFDQQRVTGLGVTANEAGESPQPVPVRPPQPVTFSPFTFVLPTTPDGLPSPYSDPGDFPDYSPYDFPEPSPSPIPGPLEGPLPEPLPVPSPLSDPSPFPSPQPSPSPIPGPGGVPGGSPVGVPATGGGRNGGGGSIVTTPPAFPQTPPPNGDCCCPEIPAFECKFKSEELEPILINVFDKCEVNPDTGKVEPKFLLISMDVPKNHEKAIKLKFERIAEIEALQCAKSDACVAAVPDWWQVRVGADTAQLIIQYYDKEDSYKVPKYVVTVPHPKLDLELDELVLSDYKKGNWMGILTLSDNSKLIVNCESIDECERVIEELSSLIQPSFLTGFSPKVGKRGGVPLKEIEVKAKIVKLFPTGQKNLAPSKLAYLE